MVDERDRKMWRFKNLNQEHYEKLVREVFPLIDRDFFQFHGNKWNKEYFPYVSEEYLIAAAYGYGLPMEKVYRAVRWVVVIGLRNWRRELTDPAKRPQLKLFVPSQMSLYFYSLLIRDVDLLEQCRQLLVQIDEQCASEQPLWDVQYAVARAVAEGRDDPRLGQWVEAISEGNPFWLFSEVCMIALRDAGEFNKAIQEEVQKFYGTPQTRGRKRNVIAPNLMDPFRMAIVAGALERGLPLNFRDPALPIWDFPIAQRPEIVSLLALEGQK